LLSISIATLSLPPTVMCSARDLTLMRFFFLIGSNSITPPAITRSSQHSASTAAAEMVELTFGE
jgi:hypothetical protein